MFTRPVERGHGNLRAQRGFPRREFEFVNQIVAVHVEVGMLGEPHAQIQIAAAAFAAPAPIAEFLPLGDARRNLDLMRLGRGPSVPHVDRRAPNRASLLPA